eukprot:g8356.t1
MILTNTTMLNITNFTTIDNPNNRSYTFIAKTLATACDVPIDTVFDDEHFTLMEFCFTACMIVVALASISSIWSIFTACCFRKQTIQQPIDKIVEYLEKKKYDHLSQYTEDELRKGLKQYHESDEEYMMELYEDEYEESISSRKLDELMVALKKKIDDATLKKKRSVCRCMNRRKTEAAKQKNGKILPSQQPPPPKTPPPLTISKVIPFNQDKIESAKTDAEENVQEEITGNIVEDEDILPLDVNEIEVPDDGDDEKAEFYELMLHIFHAALTIYLAAAYWINYIPNNLNEKSLKINIICRAAHFTVMPLFKPISLTMWPALMPLLTFVHWQNRRKDPIKIYPNRILPGKQPFRIHWISLVYVYLVGICWLAYMFATMIFLPLFLVSSWIVLPILYILPFLFLYLPLQVIKGRLCMCRCCLGCYKTSDIQEEGHANEILDYHNIKCENSDALDEIKKYIRDDDKTTNENVEMLTLKALTILYMAASVASLYFLPMYFGELDKYMELVNLLQLDLDWIAIFQFTIRLNFRFIIAWPTSLNLVYFQIPMVVSLGVTLFQRLIETLWMVHKSMKRLNVTEKSFRFAIWFVYLPYWFGEKFYTFFEM